MFNNDDDKNQNQMKSPVKGLITSSQADGLINSGKKNVMSQWQIYTRDPNNGQIQGPHVGINREKLEENISKAVYSLVFRQYQLKQDKMILLNTLNQFKDFPGIDVDNIVNKAVGHAISDINELQNLQYKHFNEDDDDDDDEEGEL